MKVEHINPFIESVYELFSTMLDSRAKRGKVKIADEEVDPHEITALIGLSGPARGTVAVSFPESTVLRIASQLSGMEIHQFDEMVTDALGEMVNIIAGGAKARLHGGNKKPINLSLPNVVRGVNYMVEYPTETTWLDIPFESEFGAFVLRVTFALDGKGDE